MSKGECCVILLWAPTSRPGSYSSILGKYLVYLLVNGRLKKNRGQGITYGPELGSQPGE